MSIPLDRLYNFLEDVVNTNIIIYRWCPHGSKKLIDLKQLHDYSNSVEDQYPILIAHDQEPLDYNQYTIEDILGLKQYIELFLPREQHIDFNTFKELFDNVQWRIVSQSNKFKKTLLIHSEQRSDQVALYQSKNYVPVYFWSHALIALDWYRYAQHDPLLHRRAVKIPFLVYNRAWTGTREYRLKFADLLVKNNLSSLCHMGFNPQDSGHHYRTHEFKNPAFRISTVDLEKYYFFNNIDSSASADYCSGDYQSTEIEIVLETLFDDKRWHLTEKTLRAIACGHPFILAATPGSLEYLHNYGFETFSSVLDETYDCIQDPVQRLNAIVNTMKQYLSLSVKQKQKLKAIALRNKQRFFSNGFQEFIINEFLTNFNQAILSITPSQLSGGGLDS